MKKMKYTVVDKSLKNPVIWQGSNYDVALTVYRVYIGKIDLLDIVNVFIEREVVEE